MRLLPLLLVSAWATASAADRINHEGRLLGTLPVVTTPVLFNTAAADAVVSAMQIMPVDSPWNENVANRPLLANSAAMMAQIATDLRASRSKLRLFYEMNYVLVPDAQPTQAVDFFNYPDESDLNGGVSPHGLYPIPGNLPVEGWPREADGASLSAWQKDTAGNGGDRHSITVQPGSGVLWETWLTQLVGTAWQASNGAKFSLNSNTLRPAGYTSGDAAGLPMFPAIVRYDECRRGMVEHAMRIVVKRSRTSYLYPATHQAGNTASANVPAMGQRVRLKAGFVIPASWSTEEKAVLLGLKKYGALVADNGGFFSISVAPDDRFAGTAFSHIDNSGVAISDFEVVSSTGPTEGPRSPGAPTASAGAAAFIPTGSQAALTGTRTGSGAVSWKVAAGPGAVTFANATQLSTAATFSQPGRYTLLLGVDDGTHAVAYSTVVVEVMPSPTVTRSGADAVVSFATLTGRSYRLENRTPTAASWSVSADNIAGTGAARQFTHSGALAQGAQLYRVSALP